MKKESFETLIKEKDVKYSDRWKPTTINNIENKLNQGCLINMEDGIKKNIAYNIQYLEYIHVQLKELELSSTIRTSLFKNFIIIGSSIIEAIFYSIIKENKMNTKSNLKEICSTKSNPTKNGSQQVVVESIIYKVVEEYDLEMTYDSMIKKIESKKLLNIKHEAYPYIKKFKNLRNRVHLQISKNKSDSDWWLFNTQDYILMRYMLYVILSDENIKFIDKNDTSINFLLFSKNDINLLCDSLNKK